MTDKLEETITISDEIYNKIVKECSDDGAKDIPVESDEESDDEAPPISLTRTRTGRAIKFNRQFEQVSIKMTCHLCC